MRRIRTEQPPHNDVMAVFEANACSFDLPRAATFGDLAALLAHLSERHGGPLVSVDVRMNS